MSAPLSYSVGARLSDVDLMTPQWLTLLLIGLGWAVVFPALLLLRDAIEGQIDGLIERQIDLDNSVN